MNKTTLINLMRADIKLCEDMRDGLNPLYSTYLAAFEIFEKRIAELDEIVYNIEREVL